MTVFQPPGTVGLGFNTSPRMKVWHFPQQHTAAMTFGTSAAPNVQHIRLDTGIEVRVYDILHPDGTPIAVVPRPVDVSFEDDLNDVGSISVEVDTDDMPAAVWAKPNVWKVYWLGLEVFAGIAEQIQDTQIQANLVRKRVAAGRGIGQALDWMKVYPGGWGGAGTPTTTQTFASFTLARIFSTLFDQAVARGVAPWMFQNNWGNTADSHGLPWTDSWSLSIDAGTSLLDLIKTYQQQLPWDWHVDSQGGLSLWNHAGSNRSTTIRIAPAGSILSAQLTTDSTQLWDVVLVENNNQAFTEQVDSTSVTTYGRREYFTSSTTVIDTVGAADLGFQLLQGFKNPSVEKLVQFDPYEVGQRPFFDYGLGDIIGVEFIDGSISQARVIAIAMNAGQSVQPQVEVTLDFMLEQTQAQVSTLSTGAITSGSGGDQTVYGDNGSSALVIGTSAAIVITLTLEAFTDTYAMVNTFIKGVVSPGALSVYVDLLLDGSIYRTMQQDWLGAQTISWSNEVMLTAIPQGTHSASLRLRVSTGALTIQPFDLQHYYTGPNVNGGVGGGSADITIDEVIPFAGAVDPYSLGTVPTLATQTPQGIPVTTALTPYPTITDAQEGVQSTIVLGYNVQVAASADDTDISSGPSFSSTSNQLEAGNDGSFTWNFSMRFIVPSPGIPSGAVITRAFLTGVSYATNSGFLGLIYGEHAANPTAPTSNADFSARTRTTANVAWNTSQTVNTTIVTPDITSIIQELVTAFGGIAGGAAIQIFVQNNSSPVNGELILQSYDNTPANAPILTARWHI